MLKAILIISLLNLVTTTRCIDRIIIIGQRLGYFKTPAEMKAELIKKMLNKSGGTK